MMDQPQSILEHLTELRRRIIYSLIAVVIAIGGSVVYAHQAFTFIIGTAKAEGVKIVQTTFGDAFLTEFRLAIIGGLLLAFPFVLYQVVAFVLPALKPSERRLLYAGLPFATFMFIVGWAFGWFVVVPISKSFFLDVSSSAGIQETYITPSTYISFVLSICNPLGIVFELPLLVMIVARIGLITSAFLSRIRKFAFLGLLIVAAVLSPPDVISMSIFMVPLYGLYEVSILLAKLVERKDR